MAVGEWDQRQLCPDGACIGVIGPEGTCKVCGRAAPNWGDERNRGLIAPEDEDQDEAHPATDRADDEEEDDEEYDDDDGGEDEDNEDNDDDDDDEDDEDVEPEAAPRGAWSARQLCPDGACVGVIGPDGRCKVCGRPAGDAPDAAREPAVPSPTPEATAGAPTAAASGVPTEPAVPPEHAPGTGPVREFLDGLPAAAASAEPAAGDREPCPTPGCGGHIGADGRCAVCGKGAS